ncbi:hypothetical protein DPMN_180083 [Dreissena polymorpha]|uniref:Uncharacterized protein n=1 Tax=Dreissena polymorpha TaxID=45954 RepID=A0A9D4EDI9_DREPO|nr:hypothetical protein DPMN_180083 [Dreissena polymorpha]
MDQFVDNLLSPAIAAVAMAILTRTSIVLKHSLDKISPRYLKLVSRCSFSPFMVMFPQMLVVHFNTIFGFSVLTLISYSPALS